MKFVVLNKKKIKKDLTYLKEELFLKIAGEQFKRLIQLGLNIPITTRSPT